MAKGIGLYNVKKRLQLLYPGRHQLQIYSTEDSFNVSMQLLLEDYIQSRQTSAYA
jgi:LytS/YehU family sensor histidine kinase